MGDVHHEVVEHFGSYILKQKDYPILLGQSAKKYKSAAAAYKALEEMYPDSAEAKATAAAGTVAKYSKLGSDEDGWAVFKNGRQLKDGLTAEAADKYIEKSKAADAKKLSKK